MYVVLNSNYENENVLEFKILKEKYHLQKEEYLSKEIMSNLYKVTLKKD